MVIVYLVAQFFTRFEVRYELAFQVDRFTGFGVAAQAWRTVMQRKAAKATNFDTLAR